MQDRSIKMIQNEEYQRRENSAKFEQKFKDQVNDIKWANTSVIGTLKGEKKEWAEKNFVKK